MKIYNVYRTIIIRSAFAAMVCAILSSIIVFFIELEKIDHQVVDLAEEESQIILEDQLYLLSGATTDGKKLKEHIESDHATNQHFAIIEIYNKNKKLVVEVSDPKQQWVMEFIDMLEHDTSDLSLKYKRFYRNGRIVLQVFYPILAKDSEVIGYFEGGYLVDELTMQSIRRNIFLSITMAIGIVLLTAVIFCPVIIYINRDLIIKGKELMKANISILSGLGAAIAKRDSDTNSHNYRVTLYSIMIAEKINRDKEACMHLIRGAFLHDIGKIAIPDSILLKPGKLDDDEFAIMKTHVSHGVDIIKEVEWLKSAGEVVRYHHEKYDGTGYLEQLKEDQIPVNAKIFTIADVFDALTSERPYKKAFSKEKALDIMQQGKGKHFDPVILEAFFSMVDELYETIYSSDLYSLKQQLNGKIVSYLGISN